MPSSTFFALYVVFQHVRVQQYSWRLKQLRQPASLRGGPRFLRCIPLCLPHPLHLLVARPLQSSSLQRHGFVPVNKEHFYSLFASLNTHHTPHGSFVRLYSRIADPHYTCCASVVCFPRAIATTTTTSLQCPLHLLLSTLPAFPPTSFNVNQYMGRLFAVHFPSLHKNKLCMIIMSPPVPRLL